MKRVAYPEQMAQPDDSKDAETLKQIRFPLTLLQGQLILALPESRVPGRYCAMNAVRHLNRAWKIKDIDFEMTALRCITAEEESAKAIFLALRACRYEGAERLRLKSHVHKLALITFLRAVNNFLAEMLEKSPFHDVKLSLSKATRRLSISFGVRGIDGYRLHPEPPLHFSSTVNDEHPDFRHQMDVFVKASAAKAGESLGKYLEEQARLREKLLYATDGGINNFSGDIEKICTESQQKVFRNLLFYLLIDQHTEQQGFVQQCLNAFLEVVTTNGKVAAAAEAEERAGNAAFSINSSTKE
jgi:hypothetical protein